MPHRMFDREPAVERQTPAHVALRQATGGQPGRPSQALRQMQHQRGNRSAQQVVQQARAAPSAAPVVQARLVLGPAHDRYEQEADRVAAAVAGHLTSQGQAVHGQAGAEVLFRKPAIGPLAGAAGNAVDAGVQQAIQEARGGGQPLPAHVRGPMEHAFGADFGGVRVHTDARAHELNGALQARAFTTGQDIFFRRGDYSAESRSGQTLLAHELTHVVQQRAAPATGPMPGVIQRTITVHSWGKNQDANGRACNVLAVVSGRTLPQGANSPRVTPPGWNLIRASYKVGTDETTNPMVAMHLWNGRLSGPGDQTWNLAPGLSSDNLGPGSMNDAERAAQTSVDNGNTVSLTSQVTYGRSTDPTTAEFWYPSRWKFAWTDNLGGAGYWDRYFNLPESRRGDQDWGQAGDEYDWMDTSVVQ